MLSLEEITELSFHLARAFISYPESILVSPMSDFISASRM